jgi:hypothetical protein
VLDESVLAKLIGKTKSMEDPRPDYYHFDESTNMALHGEFDENDDHEECEKRLRIIAHHAGCGSERTFYFRVKARLGTSEALCQKVINKHVVYYRLTCRGMEVLAEVAGYAQYCVDQMRANRPPSHDGGRLDVKRFGKIRR